MSLLHAAFVCLVTSTSTVRPTGNAAASSNAYQKSYPDGTSISVQLVGNAQNPDVVKISLSLKPKTEEGAKGEHRYQGWLPHAVPAPASAGGFAVTVHSDTIELKTTKGWLALTLDTTAAVVSSFAFNGTVLSKEVRPAERHAGAAECLPPGWKPLEKGQAASLSAPLPGGGCIRHIRSLAAGEDVYGFGQVPEATLSAVGKELPQLPLPPQPSSPFLTRTTFFFLFRLPLAILISPPPFLALIHTHPQPSFPSITIACC